MQSSFKSTKLTFPGGVLANNLSKSYPNSAANPELVAS
jgi:hypothetical protein